MNWFRLAADQGLADAQASLGFMYSEGRGVAQDAAKAVKWTRLAADQGEAFAQANLGRAYADGTGVPQDFGKAYLWFNLAAANGVSEAVASRDAMASRLTPADLSEAQRRATQCMESNYEDCD